MLGYIEGSVINSRGGKVIVKISNGLGYIINTSLEISYLENQQVIFFLMEVSQEGKANQLYGFKNIEDKEWADRLTKVNGVGARTAASIVHAHGGNKVHEAIINGDFNLFKSVKGLGLKTAKKIVLELKSSVDNLDLDLLSTDSKGGNQFVSNIFSSLENMGYKTNDITIAISRLRQEDKWQEDNLIAMIREVLKKL